MKKNYLMKGALIVIIFVSMMNIFGCVNNKENSISIPKMTQEERKSYLAKYLKDEYGIECEISDVNKRQISVIENEEDYFASAEIENNILFFNNWISNSGEIKDTAFCLDISKSVNEYFAEKLNNYWNELYIFDKFSFYQPNTKQWTSDDDFNEMFATETITNNFFLFISNSNNKDDDKKKFEKIKKDFSNYEGFIYVYYCENPKDVDVNNYDLDSYEEAIFIN